MVEKLDYSLPKHRIAQVPAHPRDSCKLLVLHGTHIEHRRFHDIVEYLERGDVLVLNDSRVMKLKLVGKKQTGGKLEFLIIGGGNGRYECLIKGKFNLGTKFDIEGYPGVVTEKRDGKFVVELSLSLEDMEQIGYMPTPPYIKGPVTHDEWYQTVFAHESGSIAAPTAGLHFTENLLQDICDKGISVVFVLLHVGLATFMPPEKMANEQEYFRVGEKESDIINNAKGKIFAVGTSTIKALESSSKNGMVHSSEGWSTIFISPGYKIQSPLDGMITNFHMPNSGPLMLTAAFTGSDRLMSAYRVALSRDYRFLSFGDAMLVLLCSK